MPKLVLAVAFAAAVALPGHSASAACVGGYVTTPATGLVDLGPCAGNPGACVRFGEDPVPPPYPAIGATVCAGT